MIRRLSVAGVLLLSACTQAPAPAARSGSCADAVQRVQASPEMNVQGGARHQTAGRAAAQGYLQQAADAAARNDEVRCWQYVDQAKTALSF